jgi:uncharacterized phage infection (PIP) family protein YhgE
MADVVTGVQAITDIMNRISNSTMEQSSGINQVNQAVGQLDQMTQQNAALVEEASAAATSLQQQATRLSAAVGFFNLENKLLTASAGVFPVGADAATKNTPSAVKQAVVEPVKSAKPPAKTATFTKATSVKPANIKTASNLTATTKHPMRREADHPSAGAVSSANVGMTGTKNTPIAKESDDWDEF